MWGGASPRYILTRCFQGKKEKKNDPVCNPYFGPKWEKEKGNLKRKGGKDRSYEGVNKRKGRGRGFSRIRLSSQGAKAKKKGKKSALAAFETE